MVSYVAWMGCGASELFANTKEAELFISGPASSILSGLLISTVSFPLPYEGRKRKSSPERKKSSYYRLNVFIENPFAVDAFVHGTLENKYPNYWNAQLELKKKYEQMLGMSNLRDRQICIKFDEDVKIVSIDISLKKEKNFLLFVRDRFVNFLIVFSYHRKSY